ncbi:MAG: thioredoxin [Patescibacteria group bacterium]|nr:thioredoxin [Patescibacteria group bacterium]
MSITLTDQNFEEEVIKSDSLPVLVDFWALWCGPCRMIGPIIEELEKDFEGKIKVGKLNVDENSEISGKYEVLGIPSLKFFKNGKIVDEITGVQPKEVLAEKIRGIIAEK